MKIDGKALAADLAAEIRGDIERCITQPVLGILMVAPTPETRRFVEIKRKRAEEFGVQVELVELAQSSSQEDVETALEELSAKAHGVVVQQPVPSHIDIQKLCNLVPSEKDIDALKEGSHYVSPVVGAIAVIFAAHSISLKDKKAVVVGSGKLVGIPVAAFLRESGASVSVMTKETGIDIGVLQQADIVVSGAGSPHLITKEMVSSQAVLIDAGTSESNGALVGDVSPECYDTVRLVSPVPGGIGPLTVMYLFKNLMKSASCSS